MSESDLHVRGALSIPESELAWRFSRSGGPGGQSVNTSDTKASLSFDIVGSSALSASQRSRLVHRLGARVVEGTVTVTASTERSQYLNRQHARRKLARLLSDALAPPPRRRRPTKPSRAAVERRLGNKQRRSQLKRLRRNTED